MPDNYEVLDERGKADLLRKLRRPVRKHRKPTIDVVKARTDIRPEYDRDYNSGEPDED